MNQIVCTDPLGRGYFLHLVPAAEKKLPEFLLPAGQSRVVRENRDFHRVLVETIFNSPSQVVFLNEVADKEKKIGIRISPLTLGCTCLLYPGNMLLTQLYKPIRGNDWKVRFWITLGLKSYCEKDEFFDAELEQAVREFAEAMTYPWAYPHRVKYLSLTAGRR